MAISFSDDFSQLILNNILPLSLMISYLMVAIILAIARITRSPVWESYFREELHQAVISSFYLVGLLLLLPILDSFVDVDYIVSNFEPMVRVAVNLPVKMISINYAISLMNSLMFSPTGNVQYPFVSIGTSIYYNPISALQYLSSLFLFNSQFVLFGAAFSMISQLFALSFVKLFLPMFLALGLMFRAFSYTRTIGNTLLGVMLGSYFMFGLAMSVEGELINSILIDWHVSNNFGTDPVGGLANPCLGVFTHTVGSEEFYSDLYSCYDKKVTSSLDEVMGNDVAEMAVAGGNLMISASMKIFSLLNPFTYIYDFCLTQRDHFCDNWLCKLAWGAYCIVLGLIAWVAEFASALSALLAGIEGLLIGTVGAYANTPLDYADLYASTFSDSLALASPVLVMAFFTPFLNIMLIMAGARSMVEAFGGDVSIVDMFMFI